MSTMTHTTTTRRIARVEWTKLRTLPSTWRTAALTTVAAAGIRPGQRLDGRRHDPSGPSSVSPGPARGLSTG